MVVLSSLAVMGGTIVGSVAAAAGPSAEQEPKATPVEPTSAAESAAHYDRLLAVNVEVPWATTTTTSTTVAPTTTSTTAAPATTAPPAPEPAPAPAPAPPPPPPPPPAPSGSVEQVIAAWFPENTARAVQIARCESGLNPGAMSPGGGNHGLFQINNVHQGSFTAVTGRPWSAVYDANANAQFARYLYNQSGWGPWGCA
jgi:hypothetical protein